MVSEGVGREVPVSLSGYQYYCYLFWMSWLIWYADAKFSNFKLIKLLVAIHAGVIKLSLHDKNKILIIIRIMSKEKT